MVKGKPHRKRIQEIMQKLATPRCARTPLLHHEGLDHRGKLVRNAVRHLNLGRHHFLTVISPQDRQDNLVILIALRAALNEERRSAPGALDTMSLDNISPVVSTYGHACCRTPWPISQARGAPRLRRRGLGT